MAKFVSKEPVPVRIDGDPNTIYIKPKMDLGTRNDVMSLALRAQMLENGKPQAMLDMGQWNIALLTHNIVRWDGPDFEGIPCNTETIRQLDDADPLVEQVLIELNRRNMGGSDPNSSTPATNGHSKAKPSKVQLASGT